MRHPSVLNTSLFLLICLFLYLAFAPHPLRSLFPFRHFIVDNQLKCAPEDYAAGYWTRNPGSPMNASTPEDIVRASGWTGCAGYREPLWQLAADDQKMIPWRGNASHYTYVPPDTCRGYAPPRTISLVQLLVERGGWLILGDTVSEGHFFSLSCELYPHVRAEPTAFQDPYDWDKPQHLFLREDSWLVPKLKLPPGFDFNLTPLVTFYRSDLWMESKELLNVFHASHPNRTTKPRPKLEDLFGDTLEYIYDVTMSNQLELFTSPPPFNYGALITSSGTQWTESVFDELRGPDDIVDFFAHATREYVSRIGETLVDGPVATRPKWSTAPVYTARTSSGYPRRVVFRAAITGTENCLDYNLRLSGPLREKADMRENHRNWEWIWRLNERVGEIVTETNHPRIHWLPIDRPAMLRADAVSCIWRLCDHPRTEIAAAPFERLRAARCGHWGNRNMDTVHCELSLSRVAPGIIIDTDSVNFLVLRHFTCTIQKRRPLFQSKVTYSRTLSGAFLKRVNRESSQERERERVDTTCDHWRHG